MKPNIKSQGVMLSCDEITTGSRRARPMASVPLPPLLFLATQFAPTMLSPPKSHPAACLVVSLLPLLMTALMSVLSISAYPRFFVMVSGADPSPERSGGG